MVTFRVFDLLARGDVSASLGSETRFLNRVVLNLNFYFTSLEARVPSDAYVIGYIEPYHLKNTPYFYSLFYLYLFLFW